jgi:two-component system response regulator
MGRRLRVLLVEDEQIDVMNVERAVRERRLDSRVEVVETAEAALERLSEDRDVASEAPLPELILTDLRLPVLSGLELLERVKADERLRCIPVVILSTSSLESDVQHAYDANAAGYVVKPSSARAFADALEKVLRYWDAVETPPAKDD